MSKSDKGFIFVFVGLLIMIVGGSDGGSFITHLLLSLLDFRYTMDANWLDLIIRGSLLAAGFIVSLIGVMKLKKVVWFYLCSKNLAN